MTPEDREEESKKQKLVVESKVICPYCKLNVGVISIYRPEVFEYSFFCNICDKGFN